MAMSYVSKHPKSGVYRVRVVIPAELRPVFKKSEFLQTLATKNLADAKVKAGPVVSGFLEQIERAKAGERYWLSHDLEITARQFLEPYSGLAPYGSVFEDQAELEQALDGFCKPRGIAGRDRADLLQEVLAADGVVLSVQETLAKAPVGPRSAITAATPATVPPSKTITLSGIRDNVVSSRQDNAQYRAELSRTFNLLIRLIGDLPAHEVTMDHIREYRDILLSYPIGRQDGDKADSMDIREVPKQAWARTISPRTVKGYLGYVGMGFKWARSEGYTNTNPREGILVKDRTETSIQTEREDFQKHHLEKLFAAPLFKGCKDERHVFAEGTQKVRDYRYWLIVLGLYTGARLRELCQLERGDIKQDNGKTWYFEITTYSETGKKSLKNKQSKRTVPVHQELIKLGFIAWVKDRKGMIFDHKPTCKEVAHEYSKWFARFMDKTGLPERALTYHSFRHTWKSHSRLANIPKEIADQMQGHAPENVGGEYGRNLRRVEYLKQEIDKIKFDVKIPK